MRGSELEQGSVGVQGFRFAVGQLQQITPRKQESNRFRLRLEPFLNHVESRADVAIGGSFVSLCGEAVAQIPCAESARYRRRTGVTM